MLHSLMPIYIFTLEGFSLITVAVRKYSRSRYVLDIQSDYNELRFDAQTVLTVHKSFVFRLLN